MAFFRLLTVAFCVISFAITSTKGDVCQKPQVTSNVYTTTDGTVITNVGFIAEFSVSCANNVKNMNLYAEINGKTMPATKAFDGNRYQVSWTSDPKEVKSFYNVIKIFDEEGFAALRKAQRTGENLSSIQPLFTIDIQHHGTYYGPWFHTELVATAVSVGIWYFAYTTKSKLMS